MNRREALAALLAVPGLTVQPITTHVAAGELAGVLIKTKHLTDCEIENLRQRWRQCFPEGTPIGDVPVVILGDGIDVELVRKREL